MGGPGVVRPHAVLTRREWAALRGGAPMPLSGEDLASLAGLNEPLSVEEVADVHLPLARLLGVRMDAARGLDAAVRGRFLGQPAAPPPPFVVALAGSVGVGKSTFARVLQAVLARSPRRPIVALVATDGFLHPTRVLRERGLMERKGHPESYDLKAMLRFLTALKSGAPRAEAPVYSHEAYDVVPGRFQSVERPDILIFEGLNVLQVVPGAPMVASDFFDFSIYLDAETADIEPWYVERFLALQRTAFQRPASYFHRHKDLPPDEAREVARDIWRRVNLPNLVENIRPTRGRADLVLRKDASHAVEEVWLRRA